MPRQLRDKGGIASVTPRENYGLGSKIKDRFRKLIPNELADNDGLSFLNNLNFREINNLKNYKISSLNFFEDDILEIRNLKK